MPHATTLHGRLDLADLQPVYTEFTEMPVVSISNDQRIAAAAGQLGRDDPPRHAGRRARRPAYEPGEYLAFLGRISPEKRADRAIEMARRTGLPLRVAAKVDDADREYYEKEIEPMLEGVHVDFIGEIGPDEKADFLGHASALVFPIDWAEPFGLVMIESMACATPVIAYGPDRCQRSSPTG